MVPDNREYRTKDGEVQLFSAEGTPQAPSSYKRVKKGTDQALLLSPIKIQKLNAGGTSKRSKEKGRAINQEKSSGKDGDKTRDALQNWEGMLEYIFSQYGLSDFFHSLVKVVT